MTDDLYGRETQTGNNPASVSFPGTGGDVVSTVTLGNTGPTPISHAQAASIAGSQGRKLKPIIFRSKP